MGHLIFQDILIIFLISIPVVIIFHHLRLPSILGFLVTGAVIGPEGIGWISDKQRIDILAELGVALLLFTVGLEFSLAHFAKLRRQSLIAGIVQISSTIAAGMLIGYWLGWSPYRGLYFGCLIALSSTAVVLTTMYDRRLIDSLTGQLSTGVLILQDLALIPMMVLLPLLGRQATLATTSQTLLLEAGRSLLIIIVVSALIRGLAPRLLGQVTKRGGRELFVIAVTAIALGMAWLTHHLGLSFALGAFIAGVIIGGTHYKYQALSDISPFRYCFNNLFFVSIGMLLNFTFLKSYWAVVLALLLLIPTLKSFLTMLAVRMTGLPWRIALTVGISLAQIGEFSFLLAYIGRRAGVLQPFFYQLIVTVAVVAMLVTPLMVTHAHHLTELILKIPGLQRLKSQPTDQALSGHAHELKDHVIICGFGPLGKTFGHILQEHYIPYLVLELNPETIERLRQAEQHVFYGDGASEEILYQSGIEQARLLAITVPDFLNNAAIIHHARKLNPEIRIITRSKYRSEVERLYAAGADVVISEELEGGVEMGRYALREVGLSEEEVSATIEKVREFGSADFF